MNRGNFLLASLGRDAAELSERCFDALIGVPYAKGEVEKQIDRVAALSQQLGEEGVIEVPDDATFGYRVQDRIAEMERQLSFLPVSDE